MPHSTHWQRDYTEAEAAHVAAELVQQVPPTHRVWLFYGELGAGKTTLIRELCQLWGVRQPVTSPTFSLLNVYDSPQGQIGHIDAYRLSSPQEAWSAGLAEALEQYVHVLIEWPEVLLPFITGPTLQIKLVPIEAAAVTSRRLTVSW